MFVVSIPNKKLKLNISEGILQERTCIFLSLNTSSNEWPQFAKANDSWNSIKTL